MKNPDLRMTLVRINMFLLVLFQLPCLVHSQNVVLNVKGKTLANGQPVKQGDVLDNYLKIAMDDPNAELKLLSPVGVCVIKYSNYKQNVNLELLDLIKSCIRKNSVATLSTRAWEINPDKDRQLQLVDSMCRMLNVTPDNVDEMFSRYITPYCVLEFETPYWQDIAQYMKIKYDYKPVSFTGERITPEQYEAIQMVPVVRSIKPLPAAASLKKYCPMPGNQGKYGTCSSWASAYGARTISWAVKNNLTDVQDITNQAFSPSFVYTQVKDYNDNDCSHGAYIDKSAEVLKDKGAVFLTDLPYGCNPDITPFLQKAKTYVIKDFQRLTTYAGIRSEADFNNIKRAIADNKPVICCIKCYQSFTESSWGSKVWKSVANDSLQGSHAICMIGYDDNFDNGDGSFGAVELINSWGTLWGDGGFIHIKYSDFRNLLFCAVAFYDASRPVPPPEPPKPEPVPPQPLDTLKRMEGSFDLILNNGTFMQLEGDETTFRGLRLASNEKMTYNILNTYPGGTQFRISITSSQPAYIYVISTDSRHSPMAQLFPDPEKNISALLDFSSEVSIAIPDEKKYIEMDETPGEDYLCVIFSKDRLDMTAIKKSFHNNSNKSFVKTVKEVLADKIVADNEVTFEKNQIAFKAASANHTVIPVFVKIKHS